MDQPGAGASTDPLHIYVYVQYHIWTRHGTIRAALDDEDDVARYICTVMDPQSTLLLSRATGSTSLAASAQCESYDLGPSALCPKEGTNVHVCIRERDHSHSRASRQPLHRRPCCSPFDTYIEH